jgi:hypothetical protein
VQIHHQHSQIHSNLYTRELKHFSDDVYRNIYTKNYGFSLRLVRPAAAGEVTGTIVSGEYAGNDGTLYDGIVIGTQVWIDKNLSETKYNDLILPYHLQLTLHFGLIL